MHCLDTYFCTHSWRGGGFLLRARRTESCSRQTHPVGSASTWLPAHRSAPNVILAHYTRSLLLRLPAASKMLQVIRRGPRQGLCLSSISSFCYIIITSNRHFRCFTSHLGFCGTLAGVHACWWILQRDFRCGEMLRMGVIKMFWEIRIKNITRPSWDVL